MGWVTRVKEAITGLCEKKIKKIEKPVVSTVDKSLSCVIILTRKYNPRSTWVFCRCGVSEGIIRIAFHHPPPKPGSVF